MGAPAVRAQSTSLDDLAAAVVHIKATINRDGATVQTLGSEREGTGIVIDAGGLVLTIGYLMVEAKSIEVSAHAGRTMSADVVGYDPETGFGLLRTSEAPRLEPIALGTSAAVRAGDPVLIASAGGPAMMMPARVVSRRAFAGAWEYLLDQAIFTAPPHPEWSGAALIGRDRKLIGVGSLAVADATGDNDRKPGNMFVPIDLLPPILGDLIADGRVSGPAHPWLGIYSEETGGRLLVARVTPGGPAEKAGIHAGDAIVGVNGEAANSLRELYRQIWKQGTAGATIRLDVRQGSDTRRLDVRSINRLDLLKLKSTL
ncbi:MAG TPA: S1C family serine protease [Xanthobacteraceae bacterium]|nr:S1C family serine protease [Xanthobacteraceae bacterium]